MFGVNRCVVSQVATADVLSQVMIFFKCTDADGSGSLDRHEIMHMLLTTQRKLAAQASLIIDMLIALDEDGDGTGACTRVAAA